MIFIKSAKILQSLALAVLLWQIVGLFFCGDLACLNGEGDEICQTLLCSLPDTHDHPQPPFSEDDSCQCPCYLSYYLPDVNFFSGAFVNTYFSIETQLFLPTPASRIDHIPRA